eukprot:4390804-Pleurochrysis_carterae.AAC.1
MSEHVRWFLGQRKALKNMRQESGRQDTLFEQVAISAATRASTFRAAGGLQETTRASATTASLCKPTFGLALAIELLAAKSADGREL